MRPRFSIALLSEDRSEGTWRGLRAIVERLLRRFEDDGFTRRTEIVPPEPNVRPVLIANRWRDTTGQYESEKRELWRYLARKVSEPGGVVVFHYDGDGRWSRRGESTARAQFAREVRTRVEQVLAAQRLPREEIAKRMGRLVECVPFYSVEAWIYQATERAIQLCQERYRGADAGRFREWGADRTRLDEVPKPKEETCLRDKHNDELGRHVPVWEVVQAGRSMTWFVWCLHACGDLLDE